MCAPLQFIRVLAMQKYFFCFFSSFTHTLAHKIPYDERKFYKKTTRKWSNRLLNHILLRSFNALNAPYAYKISNYTQIVSYDWIACIVAYEARRVRWLNPPIWAFKYTDWRKLNVWSNDFARLPIQIVECVNIIILLRAIASDRIRIDNWRQWEWENWLGKQQSLDKNISSQTANNNQTATAEINVMENIVKVLITQSSSSSNVSGSLFKSGFFFMEFCGNT